MSEIKRRKNNPYSKVKIAQISDIHWRGHQRHEEYINAFEKLYEQLKEHEVNAIVCTGDIFHTKTQNITPEVIDKLVWMFRELAKIAPLHIILGNHDGNLANEDRQDAISPLLNAMGGGYRTFFYKKSGVYPFIVKGKVDHHNEYDDTWTSGEELFEAGWLGVYSLFDKEGWGTVSPKKEKDYFDIALFHGSVNGCLTDGDYQMTECDTDVAYFNKYDLVMLGDIHKQQYLGWRAAGTATKNMKPWIGYPGSLIQQDYGELQKKGWYLWSLLSGGEKKNWDVEFVELPNDMPFITVPWMGDVDSTIKNLLEVRENNILNNRIRIATKQNISQVEVTLLYQGLKEKLKALEVTFKQEEQKNIENVETETVTISKQSLRNDPEALRKLYKEYIKNSNGKHVLTEEQLLSADAAINEYMKKLSETLDEDVVRNVVWSLKGMEFSNLYCYGEGNKINFQNMNGIIGIFGANATGKSSIVGSLMYGLYNTTDRNSVKSAQIVNRKKKEGSARILINVGGTDYIIDRKTTKSSSKKRPVEDEDKALTSLQLYRLATTGDMVEITSENDIKRSDTDKIVRRLIGSSEDFLMTAFSNQGGINRFIEEGATVRKEILNRFLDLDIFKKLYLFADKDYSIIDAKTSSYNLGAWETTMFQIQKSLTEKETKVLNIRQIIDDLRNDLEEKKLWVKNNQNLNQQELNSKSKLLEIEIVSLQKEILKFSRALEVAQTGKEETEKRLKELSDSLQKESPEKLQSAIKALDSARKSLSDMKSNLNVDKVKLDSMRKSIRKLDIVPCGDTFPECHFIKDSHEDKKNLSSVEEMVKSTMNSLLIVENNIKGIENEKNEDRLRSYNQMTQSLALSQQKLPSLIKEIDLLLNNININTENLKTKEKLLSEIREKLDISNNQLFEERVLEVKTIEKMILVKENELQNILLSIGGENNKIAQMLAQKEECKSLLEELKIYDSIREAFSKNGIPAMILKTQLPAINLELDKILSGIVNFRVSLETEVNTVNTLDVFITDERSRRVIELGSGMEKMISSLALRAALVNLSSLPKPDIFIIDEGFGVLDAESKVKCMQLLQSLKEKFKAILVISHIPEIKEISDKIIEIKNVNGESLVQV